MAYGKLVSARIKDARAVTTAAETHGATVAAGLDRTPGLPAGTALTLFTRLAAFLLAPTTA